jgi:hypothetical protein
LFSLITVDLGLFLDAECSSWPILGMANCCLVQKPASAAQFPSHHNIV